jgi:protein TIF31
MARDTFKEGKTQFAQELFMESLTLHDQIYGILHRNVAATYHSLSSIYYSLGEKQTAAELARKAVLIYERTAGLDHQDTLHAYASLANAEQNSGRAGLALKYILHALSIARTIYGQDHPESLAFLSTAASCLQILRRFPESLVLQHSALRLAKKIKPSEDLLYGTLLFGLAQTQALNHEPKDAVKTMRDAANLFRTQLGAEDRATKEAEHWLQSLTTAAVKNERKLKELNLNMDDIKNGTERTINGRRLQWVIESNGNLVEREIKDEVPAERKDKGQPQQKLPWKKDHRDVDKLLRFINGPGDNKKAKTIDTEVSIGGKKKATKSLKRV